MDVIKYRRWLFLLSLVIIVPGVVFLISAPGLRAGIDFTGGSTTTFQFANTVEQQDLRDTLADLDHSEATVQKLEDNTYFVRTKLLDDEDRSAIIAGLEAALSEDGVEVLSFDLVSPVVASRTVLNAFWAVLAAAVGIFLYLWWAFRSVPKPFRYGVAAIIALLHDPVIVLGIFAILGSVADVEVNLMFLIAVLTVIGYSVNDTIVVFDRLRENILYFPNRTLNENVNVSISETLGRSLNTSFTLLFAILALMLFGGPTIREFLLVLLIGVAAGTYSSIAVAAQVLVIWENGDVGRLFRRLRSTQPSTTA